jgi:hypothetical protein
LSVNSRIPDFQVDNGVLTSSNLEIADIDKLYATTLIRPTQQPSLNLNFLKGTLDSRINFSRASGATVVGANGLIQYVGNNVPRFDYSTTSTGTCLGLLMEEPRTNYFANTGLVGGGVIAKNAGTAIGPDGKPAHKFTVGGAAAVSYPGWGGNGANYTYSVASGTVITASFTGYFGPGFGNQALEPHIVIQFSVGGSGSPLYNEVQINTGTWTLRQNSLPAGITQVTAPTITRVTSGMYKVSYTIKYTDDGTLRNTMGTYIQVRDTSLSGTYATDGTSGVQYACLQTEVGYFPTSYIPTETTSVTRAADVALISGQNFNSWYNPTAGTLYWEGDTIENTELFYYRWPLCLSASTASPDAKIGFFKGLGSAIDMDVRDVVGNTIYAVPLAGYNNPDINKPMKVALSYKSGSQFGVGNIRTNDIIYISTGTFNSTVIPPQNIKSMFIGWGDYYWCGHMRKITYYPEQLTNTQTQSLVVL